MKQRKKYDPLNDLLNALPGLIPLGLLYIWLRTGDLSVVVAIYLLILILILGTVFFLYSRRRKILLSSGIDQIDKMDGKMFEQLLLEYFRKLGYKGKLTSEAADYGADLILQKGSVKYAIQAKRWKNDVGIEAVQQIVGAVAIME